MANIFKKIKTGTKDRWQSSVKDFGHAPNVIAWWISTVPKAINALYQLTPQATINRQFKKLVDPSLKNESFSQRNKRFSQKVDSIVEPLWLRWDKTSRTMYDLWNIAWDIWLSMIPANAISKISLLSKLPKYIKWATVLWAQLAIPTFSANEQVLAWSNDDVGLVQPKSTKQTQNVPIQTKPSKPIWTDSKWDRFTISDDNIYLIPYTD